ncbi:helix-turn-helix domain-containing protein, partial [Leuconostoc mesenteroides]
MSSLSSDERTVVQTLLELNFSIRGIARFLNHSPATISVEIRQVTPYNAKQAHQ